MFKYTSNDEPQTRQLGAAIGRLLPPGFVVGLNGTLGAGKTRLTQAIGSALGIEDGAIVSPTYTICTPHEGQYLLIHLDAYRLREAEEIDELGLDELLDYGAVLIIEWAERIDNYLPEIDLAIQIEPQNETARLFTLTSSTDAGQQLLKQLPSELESQSPSDPT